MIPRRNEDGWRDLGPLTWRIDREDNHGDRSTTTRLSLTWTRRWSLKLSLTRGWTEFNEGNTE